MSARTRKNLYRILVVIFGLAALFGLVMIALSGLKTQDTAYIWVIAAAIGTLILLPVSTLVHEGGHLLFGWCTGMKFASVRLGLFRIVRVGKKIKIRFLLRNDAAGSCEMYPKDGNQVYSRMVAFSLGGAIFNFLYAIALLLTVFLCEMHPALFFFQLFMPLCFLEGFASLFPAQTAAGGTDGEMVRALIQKEPVAVLSLRVMTAHGILKNADYSALSHELLFDTPVVREDEPAFLAITQLRWQYRFFTGDLEGAQKELSRMEELYDYIPEIARGEVACDLAYAYCAIEGNLLRAEAILSDVMQAKGSCAFYRAMAAYSALRGEDEGYFELAHSAIKDEYMVGVARLEEKFIEGISSLRQ